MEKTGGVEAIQVSSAWNYKDAMQTVKVGLIDDMFDTSHEDINFTKVWNNPNSTYIYGKKGSSHGTFVAGTMAATFNNSIGISGIIPNNKLYAYSIMGPKTDSNSKK